MLSAEKNSKEDRRRAFQHPQPSTDTQELPIYLISGNNNNLDTRLIKSIYWPLFDVRQPMGQRERNLNLCLFAQLIVSIPVTKRVSYRDVKQVFSLMTTVIDPRYYYVNMKGRNTSSSGTGDAILRILSATSNRTPTPKLRQFKHEKGSLLVHRIEKSEVEWFQAWLEPEAQCPFELDLSLLALPSSGLSSFSGRLSPHRQQDGHEQLQTYILSA